MTTPAFAAELLGWRGKTGNPNTSDADNAASIRIAASIMERLGVRKGTVREEGGVALELAVEQHLVDNLPARLDGFPWQIAHGGNVTNFDQYAHLARLQDIIDRDETRTLSTEIGSDYVIAPDVTIGIETGVERPVLHAAISCKWTMRSDRVQNVRHEAVILTRHRRGRQPHIVVVTAEPLASRVASIARGTGEVDAVYHIAFEEWLVATEDVGTNDQRRALGELVAQGRVREFDQLLAALRL